MKPMMFLRVFLLVILLAQSGNVYSGLWDDMHETVTNVTNLGFSTVTAPIKALEATTDVIFNHGDANQIVQPFQKVINEAGATIGSTTRLITDPQRDLYQEAEKFAQKYGTTTEFLFDVSTFTNRYFIELGYTSGQFLAKALQGQNPFQATALPLAAAISSARERFISNAKPIPDDVKNGLRGAFPDETLNRAKYAIGKIEITLPNLFNNLNVNLCNYDNHAVTVDDIIVFYSDPGDFNSNKCLWSHEMVHVDQYRLWGVEKFAWNFLNSYNVEGEANQIASRITNMVCDNGRETFLGIAGGSSNGKQTQRAPSSIIPVDVFMAQIIFNNNLCPVFYYVTNTSKIIAVDMYNGSQYHIGFAARPINNNFAWDIETQHYRYAVSIDGNIWARILQVDAWGNVKVDFWGRPCFQDQIIGHVYRFQ